MRYSEAEQVWSAEPNEFVRDHFTAPCTGNAIDLGCGEGRNSLWLAKQGYQVTGIDFSSIAIEKARATATRYGLEIQFEVVDLEVWQCTSPRFDAAVICYIHLPKAVMHQIWLSAFECLNPGGELLIVGHHTKNLSEGVGGPQSLEVLFDQAEVAAILGVDNLIVSRAAIRKVSGDQGDRNAIDAVVIAKRPV